MLYIKMVTYKLKKYKLYNCTNALQILYMCKENIVKQLAGEEWKIVFSA